MACGFHTVPSNSCTKCLREIIEDQGKIINTMYDRREVLEHRFPYLIPEFIRLEDEIPLMRNLK
jgi:hypothetical protein